MKNKFCLIFDVDGTLWDATSSILDAGNERIEQIKGWKNYLTKELTDSVMGMEIEEIAETYFPTLPKEEKMELIYQILNHENEYLSKHGGSLYDNVEDTLRYLYDKYDLFIVTNAQDGYVEALFSAHPLKHFFKDYECYGRTNRPKGENIQLLMKRNGYTKAYYIGDTQKDREACKLAKIPFVYASYGFGNVDQFDLKIDSFEELRKIF